MGKENLPTSHPTQYERKLLFIQEAIAQGALDKLPPGTTPKQWKRQQDIGITYAFGEESLESLGDIFKGGRNVPLEREGIRQLSDKFIKNLWNNSSDSLKASVSMDVIKARKPTTQKSRENISAAHGGLSLRIKKLLEKGITDPRQIQAELGLSFERMGTNRKVLKSWGIELPRIRTSYERLKEKVAKETDDDTLQNILDDLSNGQIRGYLHDYGKSEDAVFTSFSIIARNNGFHIQPKRVAEATKKAGIPIRAVEHVDKNAKNGVEYYWVVFAKHEQRIVQVLRNNPNL